MLNKFKLQFKFSSLKSIFKQTFKPFSVNIKNYDKVERTPIKEPEHTPEFPKFGRV